MKKTLIILLAVLAVLACLTGCGKDSLKLHDVSVTEVYELNDEDFELAKVSDEYWEEYKSNNQPNRIECYDYATGKKYYLTFEEYKEMFN